MKVGLPRALVNYDELPLWQTFLSELGAEAVISPETNRAILSEGLKRSAEESCLPVKAFVGHLLTLGKTADFLFVPRLVNRGRRNYYCPKFAGLPDISRSFFRDIAPVLEVTVDLFRNPRALSLSLEEVARRLGRSGCGMKAYESGLVVQRHAASHPQTAENPAEGVAIGLLGRSYSLLDPLVGFDVLARLQRLGVQIVMGNSSKPGKIPQKLYWEQDRRLFGVATGWLSERKIDGLVHVVSFECGPDALFTELLEEACREADLPLLSLVLDEHAEETGLVTRLEAFVDLLSARVGRRRCIR